MTLGLEPTPRGTINVRMGVMAFAGLVLLVMQSVIARSWPIRLDASTLVIVFLALETSFGTACGLPCWSAIWPDFIRGYQRVSTRPSR